MKLSDKWHPHSLLIPPTHFCSPSDKHPSFSNGSVMRSRSVPLQQASICLEMSLCCSAFYGNERIRRVGGREEIPVLREASPLLGQSRLRSRGIDGDWMVQLFPQQTALLILHWPCFLCYVSRKGKSKLWNQSSWKETFVLCLQYLMQWKPNQRNCEYLANNPCFFGNWDFRTTN